MLGCAVNILCIHIHMESRKEREKMRKSQNIVASCICFCGCCNDLPSMRRLKTTEMCFLIYLETRSSKSVNIRSLEGEPVPCLLAPSLWWLLAILSAPCPVIASLQCLPLSSHKVFLCVFSSFSSLIGAIVIEFRLCPNPQ